MNTHHCTCEECERRRQQAEDEAFATMVVLAQYHPEWFMFGDHHVHDHGHHDIGAFVDDEPEPEHDDLDHDGFHETGFDDGFDDLDGFCLG